MTIHFLYGRRESLQGKSEAYKKSVREYLESTGFSQTMDSRIQGTLADMAFVNPVTDPGKKFLVETKAEVVTLKSKRFARELIAYFKLSKQIGSEGDVRFKLFAQGVKQPTNWESIFSEKDNFETVQQWCRWYNEKCLEEGEQELNEVSIKEIAEFFAKSEVTVGNVVDLQQAVLDSQSISDLSVTKMAKNLLGLVDRRTSPVSTKSKLIMNILPIVVPENYYSCRSTARNKQEIYDGLKDKIIPPFLFIKTQEVLTFSDFDQENPLSAYITGPPKELKTKELQEQNPTFSAQLVNVHLRRIFWNRGVYRDPKADIYYFPMLDKTAERREILDHRKMNRRVVRKIVYTKDTPFHKKGEINFFFHRGVELRTPTYWGSSFVELIPRRYYTLDGEHWTDGKIRARIDRRFRNPKFDRSKTRLGLMKFWRFIMFESDFVIPPEKWFDKFKFGHFLTETVNWSPQVIGRTQMRLWDSIGEANQ
jgi:hypothetical protein